MRVVIDTNVLISALIAPGSSAAALYDYWRENRFVLITSEEQLDEFRRVTRYVRLRPRVKASDAGTMLNEIRLLAIVLKSLPSVDVSPDPAGNYLLSMAQVGKADILITRDKDDLLKLKKYKQTRILTVHDSLAML